MPELTISDRDMLIPAAIEVSPALAPVDQPVIALTFQIGEKRRFPLTILLAPSVAQQLAAAIDDALEGRHPPRRLE